MYGDHSIDTQQCRNPSDMDSIESMKANEYGARDTSISEELPDSLNVVVSQGLRIDTNKKHHEIMFKTCINETEHENRIPTSPSIHSHSTSSRSTTKSDSITSNASTSSEIIPTHITHAPSRNHFSNDKEICSQPGDYHYTGDERNIPIGGRKTVSTDELNAETKDYEVQNETNHEPNRDRADSIPYALIESTPSLNGKALRRGKWTQEEEAFVARAIHDFNCGFLNVPAGTTLRTYLSDKLQCNPMRVTKKFTGDACIGKRVFHPAVRTETNAAALDKAQAELEALESRWRRRLEAQHKESQRKATSTALNSSQNVQNPLIDADPSSLRENTVELSHAVSWLEQANAVLSNDTSFKQDYETEMQQVQRLIFEAPIIHNISSGIQRSSAATIPSDPSNPITSNDCTDPNIKRKVMYKTAPTSSPILRPIAGEQTKSSTGFRSEESYTIKTIPSPPPQDEKRPRTSSATQETTPPCIEESAAEDAATLMDFLFSVRNEASAASKT